MIRTAVLLCCLYFLNLTPYLYAMTDEQKEQIHKHFEALGMECIQETPITEADIQALRSQQFPPGDNGPCFIACVMKKAGIMDQSGMLQKESVLDLAKQVFQDEEELKNIADYLHSCSAVNSAPVGDGAKGCDRAKLAFVCMNENASKFGLEM